VLVELKLLKTGAMTASTSTSISDLAQRTSGNVAQSGLSRRAWIGLILLALSTVGVLALAWMWPDLTHLHFWLVAQALPIFYWLLVWWWARQPVGQS
jgi:Flp pilus assembly protein TadB